MKRLFLCSAAMILAAAFPLAGCDLFSFDKGQRFEKDGLEQVFEAMAAKNYTIEDTEYGAMTYIMENAVVSVSDTTENGRTMYTYYDTSHLETMPLDDVPGGVPAVATVTIITQYGGGSIFNRLFRVDTIQDVYDLEGYTQIMTYDWEYDEAEKLYRHDGDTLQIKGSRVTLTFEFNFEGSDPVYMSCVLKNFGATEYDLSAFSK